MFKRIFKKSKVSSVTPARGFPIDRKRHPGMEEESVTSKTEVAATEEAKEEVSPVTPARRSSRDRKRHLDMEEAKEEEESVVSKTEAAATEEAAQIVLTVGTFTKKPGQNSRREVWFVEDIVMNRKMLVRQIKKALSKHGWEESKDTKAPNTYSTVQYEAVEKMLNDFIELKNRNILLFLDNDLGPGNIKGVAIAKIIAILKRLTLEELDFVYDLVSPHDEESELEALRLSPCGIYNSHLETWGGVEDLSSDYKFTKHYLETPDTADDLTEYESFDSEDKALLLNMIAMSDAGRMIFNAIDKKDISSLYERLQMLKVCMASDNKKVAENWRKYADKNFSKGTNPARLDSKVTLFTGESARSDMGASPLTRRFPDGARARRESQKTITTGSAKGSTNPPGGEGSIEIGGIYARRARRRSLSSE